MRMTDAQLGAMRAAIEALGDKVAAARPAYAAAGRSHERFRWDVLHASKHPTGPLYAAGLDDAHIDTGLRAILGAAF